MIDRRFGALVEDHGGVLTTSIGASFAAFCIESGVDDLLQNVDGARAVGMHAFVHRNADFTIPRLEELFEMARLTEGDR